MTLKASWMAFSRVFVYENTTSRKYMQTMLFSNFLKSFKLSFKISTNQSLNKRQKWEIIFLDTETLFLSLKIFSQKMKKINQLIGIKNFHITKNIKTVQKNVTQEAFTRKVPDSKRDENKDKPKRKTIKT